MTMKTSTFITLLALTLLSLFVAPSSAKGMKSMGMGMGMGKLKKSKGGSKRSKRPKRSNPGTAPTPKRPQTCPETCGIISQLPFFEQCSFINCVTNFDCANLPDAQGFKSQVQCSQYCVGYKGLSCPQGFTTTSSPTSRCLAARCT
jgi:hypothetical protein